MKIQVAKRLDKHNKYWETRVQKIFDERERGIKADDLYRRVYDDLHAEIKALYDELGGRDLTRTELYKASKFLSFRAHLQENLTDISGSLDDTMSRALISAYKDAGLAAKDSIGAKTTWTVTNRKMAEAAVQRKWAGDDFSGRIWKNRDQLAKQVEKGVADILTTGYGRNDLLRELNRQPYRERFAPKGADQSEIEAELEAYLQRGRRQADCLVRTELMHAINTAQIETYRSEGVKYLEFECEPTACPDCIEIANGNPYSIDKLPCTIGHPRCRCTWVAVEDEDIPERVKERDGIKEKQSENRGIPVEAFEQRETKPPFMPAKTIEEAQKYAKDFCENSLMARTFKGEVNFKGISLDAANDINRALTEIYEIIPLDKLSGIKAISPTSAAGKKAFKSGSDAVFAYNPIEHGIYVNKEVLKSPKTFEAYKSKSKEAWDTVMNNIDKLSGEQKALALRYKEAGRSLVDGDTVQGLFTHELGHHAQWTLFDAKTNNLIGDGRNKYGGKISGYATANKSEYFAESFVAYIKGERSKLDPQFVKFLDKTRST